MFQAVNDLNYIFVNETALIPKVKKNFSLTIRFRDRYSVINFGEFEDNRNLNEDNNIVEESIAKVKQVVNNVNSEEEPKKEEASIFDRIQLACDSYNYFISSIGESLEITPYEDFVEFVVDAKLKYGALIVTEYGNHIDYFSDKDSMTLLNKLYLITDIFLFDEKEVLSNFKKHYEILTKENSKKIYKFGEIQINNYPFGSSDSKRNENEQENNNSNLSDNNEENQEHKEENERTEEEKEETNRYKEVEETEKSKEEHKRNSSGFIEGNKSIMSSKVNSKQLNYNQSHISIIPFNHRGKIRLLTEKDIFDYFRFDIACNGGLSILNSKLGIFIDANFSKVTFIEVPMNSRALIFSYDIKPHPKLYPSTLHKVEKYWGMLRGDRDYFKSFFWAGILSIICLNRRNNFGLDTLYPAYLKGHEILKRILHLKTNGFEFPDNPKVYIVKLNNNEIDTFLTKQHNGRKEKKFVLDCTNLEKSHLKYYVPLFDDNLHEFFDNDITKKELEKKGFINSKGFVNYDPCYNE